MMKVIFYFLNVFKSSFIGIFTCDIIVLLFLPFSRLFDMTSIIKYFAKIV